MRRMTSPIPPKTNSGIRQSPVADRMAPPSNGPVKAPTPNAALIEPIANPRLRLKNAPTAAKSAAFCIPSPTPERTRHRVMSMIPTATAWSAQLTEKMTRLIRMIFLRPNRSARYPAGMPASPIPRVKIVAMMPAWPPVRPKATLISGRRTAKTCRSMALMKYERSRMRRRKSARPPSCAGAGRLARCPIDNSIAEALVRSGDDMGNS